MTDPLLNGLLRLADDHLILGHRLSEWCGHAPMLEEDLALPNIALDLIGQARALYTYAGDIEGQERDEDALAFGRLEHEYLNALICEKPNGDFAQTMFRQLVFSCFMAEYWDAACTSADPTIAGIAAKAAKETAYHIRHSGEWVVRLGDGTDESAQRLKAAVTYLTPYVAELFEADKTPNLPDPFTLKNGWMSRMQPILSQAFVDMPDLSFGHSGGRQGIHTEDMGFLLAQLQFMQRSYPDMKW